MASTAQDVANAVLAKLDSEGIVVPAALRNNLAAVVQLFIVLSGPIRSSIRAYLAGLQVQLSASVTAAFALATRADFLSAQVVALRAAIAPIKQEIDRTLTTFPLDQVVKQSPDLANLLTELQGNLPVKIPTTQLTKLAGIGGFDFFEGIQNYKDLSNKVDELFFRAARAVSLSNYANQANRSVQDQLDRIRVYIEIIDNLNIAVTSVSVAPAVFSFGSVGVATQNFATFVVHNLSTGIVTFSAVLTGDSSYSIVSGAQKTLYSPTTANIVVKFSPVATGVRPGVLSIAHNATSPASPLLVTLTGTGV